MKPAHRWGHAFWLFLLASALVLTGCSSARGGRTTPTPSPTEVGSGSATPLGTASPSLSGSASPASVPPGTGTPGSTVGQTPSGTPVTTVAPASCPTVNPVRVPRAEVGPRRATEVVTVISDGTNLTTGTREQTDFLSPALSAPDGTTITDEPTFTKIAKLVAAQRHRVLLTRPEAPDANASASRKPFSAPGTYVIYTASSQLVADVVVQCSGAEMVWNFVSEADPSSGQINCAVEPSRSNALARLLYQNNC